MLDAGAQDAKARPQAWRPWLIALAVLLATLVATFHEGFSGSASIDSRVLLPFEDTLYVAQAALNRPIELDPSPEVLYRPWELWTRECLVSGKLPLWQSYCGLGSPLFANGQATTFNPIKLLTLDLAGVNSVTVAWALVGKLLLAGVGAMLLAASLGLGPWPATLAALAFALCAHMTYRLGFLDDGVMLPWLLLMGHRLVHRRTLAAAAALALVTGLTPLIEHPETALFMAAAAYGATAWGLWRVGPLGRRGLPLLGLAGLLGMGVAAVSIVPFALFVRGSASYLFDRHGAMMSSGAQEFWNFPQTLRSLFLQALSSTGTPLPFRFNPWVGTVALVLTPIGLANREIRRTILPLALFGALAVLLFPPSQLVDWAPVTAKSFYVTPVFSLAIALAGAAGLDALPAWSGSGRISTVLGVAAAVGALAFGLALLHPVGGATLAGMSVVDFRTPCAISACFALIVFAARTSNWRAGSLQATMVVVAAVELAVATRHATPPGPRFEYPTVPVVAFLQAQAGPFRVASGGPVMIPDSNMAFHLDSLESIEAFHDSRYAAFMGALSQEQAPIGTYMLLDPKFRPDLLDLANVGYLLVAPGFPAGDALRATLLQAPNRYPLVFQTERVQVFRNLTALPRAWVAYRAEALPKGGTLNDASARLAAGAARWRNRVLLETPDGRLPADWGDSDAPPTAARITHRSPDSVTLAATADHPGWLVLSEAPAPGWQATVDGQRSDIYAADVGFRAVKLTPGAHTVEFTYVPRGIVSSLLVSVATTVLCLGLLLLGSMRRTVPASFTAAPGA